MPFVFEPSRYPSGPGCYLMRDAVGTVLYVGKAKNLRKRLASHFGAGSSTVRRSRLLAAVADIELILVLNETEALILENNLIKLYQPRANRVLLDADEGYFYVGLTKEQLPRLVAYRKHRINKALERGGATTILERSFGPYVSRKFRDSLLSYVVDNFKLRTCAPLPGEVCLRFHLGACGGVCEGHVSRSEYARSVADAVAFLSRPHSEMISQMERAMADCAAELRFEQAGHIKRSIALLTGALEPQVVEREVGHDQHVLYFDGDGVTTLHLAAGALHGCTPSALHGVTPDEFLVHRYASGCPDELILNQVGDARGVERVLSSSTKQRVHVTLAKAGPRGVAQRLMAIAALNHAYRAMPPATNPGVTEKSSIAVVTGGNRGIGLELCRQLAAEGFVVVLGSRDLRRGEAAAASLGEGGVHVVQLDVDDDASAAAASEWVSQQLGRCDVLINNAAIDYDSDARAGLADLARVHRTMETNLFGAWRTCLAFLPLLRRSRHARIVNVSSEAGVLARMGAGPPGYQVSKAALNALTRTLAGELKSAGILVNAVSPGWTNTDMGRGGRSVQDGAASVMWAVHLPDDGPTGGFFRDGRPLDW